MKVLKFGAVWCSGCLVMRPRWEKLEKENPWLKTEYFDIDKNEEIAKKYEIEEGKLPAFIFLDKKEKEFLRMHGEMGEKELQKVIEENKKK